MSNISEQRPSAETIDANAVVVEESSTPTAPGPKPTNDNSNPQQGNIYSANNRAFHAVATTQSALDGAIVEQSQRKMMAPPAKKDPRKLFVGGLPANITNHDFRTFFEQFGEVLDSVVMFDRNTHRSRGFGFVTFVDPEVSKSLLNDRNTPEGPGRLNMSGKICEVKAAEPKDLSGKYHGRRGGNRNPSFNRGGVGPSGVGISPSPNPYPPLFFPPGVDPGGFPPQTPGIAGAITGRPFPPLSPHGYHPGGFAGYMAPMYFPTAVSAAPPAPADSTQTTPTIEGAPLPPPIMGVPASSGGSIMSAAATDGDVPVPAGYYFMGQPPPFPPQVYQQQEQVGNPSAENPPIPTVPSMPPLPQQQQQQQQQQQPHPAQAYAFIPVMMAPTTQPQRPASSSSPTTQPPAMTTSSIMQPRAPGKQHQ